MLDDDSILTVHDLAVSAGGAALMQGVRFELRENEILAVTGPSGCGKTTLLRAIAALDDPMAGEVRFGGQAPVEMGWPLFRRHVAFVHQRPVMFDESVEENLRRPLRYQFVQESFDRERAVELLEEVHLDGEHLKQQARTLSLGQQQRVALVRTLLVGPEVLLLDEPTSALDEESREAIEEMLKREMHDHGRAAVVVTHDLHQAERLCDRRIDLRGYLVGAEDKAGGQGHG